MQIVNGLHVSVFFVKYKRIREATNDSKLMSVASLFFLFDLFSVQFP
jgi:hypothetical protein